MARGPRLQEQIASDASRERQEPRRFELRSRGGSARVRRGRGGPRVPPQPRRPLGGHRRAAGPRAADRAADDRRRLLGAPLRRRRRPLRRRSSPAGSPSPSTTPASSPTSSAAERERAEIAETLQRGLLPPPLPHIPGWSVAAMYRPAGAENEVGGDFYDAFRIAGGWMVVIGDVTGRGAQAAAVTAHARYTLRTAAALTGDPVVALRDAQPRAARPRRHRRSAASPRWRSPKTRPSRCGWPSPATRRRCWSTATRSTEAAAPAPVLGAFPTTTGRSRRPRSTPGQQLVVVTDGVTEARGRGGALRRGAPARRAGAASPARRWRRSRLEGALHDVHRRRRSTTTPRSSPSPRRSAADVAEPAPGRPDASELVERLYDGLQPPRRRGDRRRSATRGWGSSRSAPPRQVGRNAPYVGPEGLQRVPARRRHASGTSC